MKKSNIILIAVIAVILIAVIAVIGSYNGLVSKQENVNTKLSDLDVVLQRRAELVPNLVNVVKGYTAHETEIIKNITDAREKLAGSTSMEDKLNADKELSTALSSLMVVVENYPDLKSSQNFIQLSDELAGTENRVATARRDYNDAVKTYNTSIKTFPTNIMASMFSFGEKTYFEATAGSQTAPVVQF